MLSAWAFSTFLVSIAISISLVPTIAGALFLSFIASYLVIKYLTGHESKLSSFMWWPLCVASGMTVLFGRIGCWMNGCCFGLPTTIPWATHYHDEHFFASFYSDRLSDFSPIQGLSVHPVQLYEGLGAGIILLISYQTCVKRGRFLCASLLFLGLYLGLHASILPFRAVQNVSSSSIYFGQISLYQIFLYTLMVLSLKQAYCYRSIELSAMREELSNGHESNMASIADKTLLWIVITWMGGLSLSFGTPFTAQISLVGVVLATIIFLLSLKEILETEEYSELSIDTLKEDHEPRVYVSNLSTRSYFLIAPLILLSLALPIFKRDEGHLPKHLNERAWVYSFDPNHRIAIRIGTAGEVFHFKDNVLTLKAQYRAEDSDEAKPISSDELLIDNHFGEPLLSCSGPSYYLHRHKSRDRSLKD